MITGSVGVAIAIFLNVFMRALILSGKVAPGTAEILGSLWIVGVIPFFVGISLIINGVFVSKRLAEIARRAAETGLSIPEKDTNQLALRSAESTGFIPSGFSVTEHTTKHLTSEHKQ